MLRREPDVRLAIDDALTDDPTAAADLAAFLVKSLLGARQPHRADRAPRHRARSTRAIVRVGTSRSPSRVDAAVGDHRARHPGRRGTRIAVLDEADQLVAAVDPTRMVAARLLALRAGHLNDAGRTRGGSCDASMRAAEIAVACGDAFNALQARHFAVTMLLGPRSPDEADELAATVIAACTDDARWIEHMARNNRAQIALERGDRAL